jgi:predicted lipoprotein
MGPPPSLEQMFDRLADRIGLTEAEKKASRKAITARTQAVRAQMAEVTALGEVARKENATDAELRAALQKFEGALTAYHQKVRAIDAQLTKALSLKAQARLTAMGVIDNGVGQRFGQRRGPGMGMQGGQGGRRGPGGQPGMAPGPAGPPPGPGQGE